MAELILGIGSSHSPTITTPAVGWARYIEGDYHRDDLVSPRSYTVRSYQELLAEAEPELAEQAQPAVLDAQHARMQGATDALVELIRDANPDSVVIVSDDQGEWLFDDNMPTFMIYWGETAEVIEPTGYGAYVQPGRVPVDSRLGEHLLHSLIGSGFDMAHSRYMKDEYGGSIGPAGYMHTKHERPPRKFGLPHGYSFVTGRLLANRRVPIVPIFQNTCYPPNQPSPRRCFALGQAIRTAIESWDSSARVALVASGGLSHQVLDQTTDRHVLSAIERNDAATLCAVPVEQLQASTSETLNWITVAGACQDRAFHLVDYVPVSRTPAGTGGGWAFGYWQ
jgi:hypothetical protein